MEETVDRWLRMEDPGWEITEGERKEAPNQFVHARPGDHLMVPFQCELCHHNKSEEDKWVTACIVRANLDLFWVRRPTTVQGNLLEVNRIITRVWGMRIKFPMWTHMRGPYPVKDSLGMVPAILSLQHLLDKGCNSRTIQWDTMRSIRSAFSNFVHTTPAGTGGAVLSDDCRSTRITGSPTNSVWFQRFMDGCHKWMGDVRIPDTALTIDVRMELDQVLEMIWNDNKEAPLYFKVATTGCMLTVGFSAGLRGKELGHIRLRESILLRVQGLQYRQRAHIIIAMEGRFKGKTSKQKHKIPLVIKTLSRIPNWKWLFQLFQTYEQAGVSFRPLFQSKQHLDIPAGIRHLDAMFHKDLLELQVMKPHVLPATMDIVHNYSVRRFLQRGSTTQVRNKKVPHCQPEQSLAS
ncbi:hypothetical protein ACA910_008701 [Epithemia clementina (nom. ined.)]